MRALGLRQRADGRLAALPAETRAMLEAYARGVNAWIAARGRFAAPEFLLLGAPEPWQPSTACSGARPWACGCRSTGAPNSRARRSPDKVPQQDDRRAVAAAASGAPSRGRRLDPAAAGPPSSPTCCRAFPTRSPCPPPPPTNGRSMAATPRPARRCWPATRIWRSAFPASGIWRASTRRGRAGRRDRARRAVPGAGP